MGLGAIKNGKMAGTAYNDKEGQAEAMLKLAFVLSEKDPDSGLTLEDIPLQDEKYVRMPYYRVTLENVEEYVEWSKKKPGRRRVQQKIQKSQNKKSTRS